MQNSMIRLFMMLMAAAFIAIFQYPASAENVTDPDKVVEKIVQAYGGRAALVRVKSVKHTGTIMSYRMGTTGTIERLLVLPDRLRVDLSYPDGTHEQRITTPEGAWRDGGPAPAPMHMAMALQAARFRLPLILTERPVTVLGELEGMLRLRVELTPSTALEVFVDPQSWRIVRSEGHMSFQGMDMTFTADYSDFRMVDGVLFAHREELTAMGRPTGIVELKSIEVNGEVRPETFRPYGMSPV